jgi:hypothetical protein
MEEKVKRELKITESKPKSPNFVIIFFYKFSNYLFLLLLVGIVITGYFFILQPKYKNINENLAANSESLKNLKDEMTSYKDKLKNYETAFNNIKQPEKDRISMMIQDLPSNEDLFALFDSFISGQGLVLSSIAVTEKEKNPGENPGSNNNITSIAQLGQLGVNLEVMGVDYPSLKSLLRKFENSLKIMDLQKLGFDLEQKKADFTVIIYYLKKS